MCKGVLPLVFYSEGKEGFTAGTSLIEIYKVEDGSWRISFHWQDKIRNIASLEEAKEIAQKEWNDWILSWMK